MNPIRALWADKRGGVLVRVWTTALVLIFAIITVYITTYDLICTRLYILAMNMAPEGVEGSYFSIINLLRSYWDVLPWVMIAGVLLWAYANSQREEYEEGLYGRF